MKSQLRLPLNRSPVYTRERYAAPAASAPALALLDAWKTWPGGVRALVGPRGSGKTHLAAAWANESGASLLDKAPDDFEALRGRYLVIEDADAWPDAEFLFHLLNMVQSGGGLLLTSRQRPAAWPAALPDLRSRLNALPVAELAAPDDGVLREVMLKMFAERNIVPTKDLLPYLLPRIERSVPAAQRIVAQLDEAAAAERREVNRALAIHVLALETVTIDLFDQDDDIA